MKNAKAQSQRQAGRRLAGPSAADQAAAQAAARAAEDLYDDDGLPDPPPEWAAARGEGVYAYEDRDAYARIVDGLGQAAAEAAMRGNVAKWASYTTTRDRLVAERGDLDGGGAVYAAALAIADLVVSQCNRSRHPVKPAKAAEIWTLGVYCRRIVEAWTGRPRRVTLRWLRARVNGPLLADAEPR